MGYKDQILTAMLLIRHQRYVRLRLTTPMPESNSSRDRGRAHAKYCSVYWE